MTYTPFIDALDEDLIRDHRASSNPVIRELVHRLGEYNDSLDTLCADLDAQSIEEIQAGIAELNEDLRIEKEITESRGDEISDLNAVIDDQDKEIKELETELSRLKETPMLEQQVVELSGKIDTLTTAINDLTDRLGQAQAPRAEPPEETPKKRKAKAKPQSQAEPQSQTEPQAAPEPKSANSATKEQALAALTTLAAEKGRPAAKAIVARFVDDGADVTFTNIPAETYGDVVAACEAAAATEDKQAA